jgi:hypothetical protein
MSGARVARTLRYAGDSRRVRERNPVATGGSRGSSSQRNLDPYPPPAEIGSHPGTETPAPMFTTVKGARP